MLNPHCDDFGWLRSCLSDVAAHNTNNSRSAHVGRSLAGILGVILEADSEDPLDADHSVKRTGAQEGGSQLAGLSAFDPQSAEEKEKGLLTLRHRYGKELEALGLRLVSTSEFLSEIGQTTPADDVFIFIGDQNKFCRFVGSLSREVVDSNPDLKALVNTLVDDSIRLAHSPLSEGERGAAVTPLMVLFERLDNLGLGEKKEEFRPLTEAQQGGYITLYVDAVRQQLVGERGFTPESWILDPAQEDFERRWQKAVALVEALDDNINAAGFQEKLVTRLLAAARSSLKIHDEAKRAVEGGYPDYQQQVYSRPYIGQALDRAITALEPRETPAFLGMSGGI